MTGIVSEAEPLAAKVRNGLTIDLVAAAHRRTCKGYRRVPWDAQWGTTLNEPLTLPRWRTAPIEHGED